MKHNGFEVKISDMLRNKVTDRLELDQRPISLLPNLSAEGVSGVIILQSLGKDAIFARIEELSCVLEESCERCGASYARAVSVQDYTAKYSTGGDLSEDSEEDILLIDMKNGVIDLEELIFHAIKLQDPFVKNCKTCESQLLTSTGDDEEMFDED